MNTQIYLNPEANAWSSTRQSCGAEAFHRSLPGYAATPLRELPALADELGVAKVFIKDESQRLGLPAFKILGASWSIARVLVDHLRISNAEVDLDELKDALSAEFDELTLVAATDGNHGRAVARTARLLGISSRIYLPDTLTPEAIDAVRAEGAEVVVPNSTYDDTVEIATRSTLDTSGEFLIQDTAWEGYHQVPEWIIEGHATMFCEIDRQQQDAGESSVDLIGCPG